MSQIDFDIFEQNSSSLDAIVSFAIGRLSFPALREEMWHPAAKAEVDKLRRRGRKKALAVVRQWCTRSGYDYSCDCHCH
jgi:hypothetical protein